MINACPLSPQWRIQRSQWSLSPNVRRFFVLQKHTLRHIGQLLILCKCKTHSASGSFAVSLVTSDLLTRALPLHAPGVLLPGPRYRFALRAHHVVVPQTLTLDLPTSLLHFCLTLFIRYFQCCFCYFVLLLLCVLDLLFCE